MQEQCKRLDLEERKAMSANMDGEERTEAERIASLKQKYDPAAIDNGMRLRPRDFLNMVEWRDRIDQHYTRAWLEFTYGGLFMRRNLDERTRLLVSVAQFLAMNEMEAFERQIPG